MTALHPDSSPPSDSAPADSGPTQPGAPPRRARVRLIALGLFVLAGIALLVFGGTYVDRLETLIQARAVDWGAWVANNALLYALLFILVYTMVSVLGLPLSVLLSLSGGAIASVAFGFWGGAVFSAVLVWVSVVLGSWGLYEFVRRFGASAFDSVVGPYIERFREGFARDQFFYMLASRFTPVPPSVMTVVPALLGARRDLFLAAATLGFFPGVAVYAFIGAKLGEILLVPTQGEALRFADLATFSNTWPLLALLALSLVPLIIRRLTAQNQKQDKPHV